jgi:hypothetical protein
MTIRITFPEGTPPGSSYGQILTVTSALNPARIDTVRLVATLEPEEPPPP